MPVLPGSAETWRREVRHSYDADQLVAKLERSGLTKVRVTPTARSAVWLAQGIADRIKQRSLRVRVAARRSLH